MPRLFCPKCSSVKDVIPIEYGLPEVYTKDMFDEKCLAVYDYVRELNNYDS